MRMRSYRKIIFPAVLLILLAIDQLSKYLIRTSGGFYICNSDLAFSLKFSSLAIITFILLLVIFIFTVANHKHQMTNYKQIQNSNYSSSKQKTFGISDFGFWNLFDIWNLKFGFLLIVSGAISNIIDRLAFGCVIDFIDLRFWPVFNLADVFISAGAIIILVQIAKKH